MSRVYVGKGNLRPGKLARDCRERDVEKLAREFGRVRDVRLLQGFAFVEFEHSRDASDCVRELDGSRFMGERVIVELAKSSGRDDRRDGGRRDERRRSPVRNNELRIRVLGLPPRTSWQDLKDLMREAGDVQYTNIDRNDEGIVEFTDKAGKEKALEKFNDYEYQGSKITLKDMNEGGSRARSPRRDSPRRDSSPRGRDTSPRGRDRSPKARERSPKSRSVSPRKERSASKSPEQKRQASPSPERKRDDSRSPVKTQISE